MREKYRRRMRRFNAMFAGVWLPCGRRSAIRDAYERLERVAYWKGGGE